MNNDISWTYGPIPKPTLTHRLEVLSSFNGSKHISNYIPKQQDENVILYYHNDNGTLDSVEDITMNLCETGIDFIGYRLVLIDHESDGLDAYLSALIDEFNSVKGGELSVYPKPTLKHSDITLKDYNKLIKDIQLVDDEACRLSYLGIAYRIGCCLGFEQLDVY